MSVEPLETELGRKRTINQSTCNKDISCVKGFCPSFITVEGGQLKKKSKTDVKINPFTLGDLPTPILPTTAKPYGMIVAGVGGTGIITIGQLLGMAAHMEGKGIITQDAAGLAQKGGATWSHVIIADSANDIRTTRVSMADADLIFGCDPLVTANKETLLRMRPGKTHVALNAHSTPTAAFVTNSNWMNPADQCAAQIADAVGADGVGKFNADAIATKLMGDSIFINPMILGYAWQKGWVPLELDSLMRAMELNNVAIEQNKQAFTWGRRAAHDLVSVEKLLTPAQVIAMPAKRDSLATLIARRIELLTAYQNAAYAADYKSFVDRVAAKGNPQLTEAIAKYLYKLMAYKDEYEVARLHSDTAFLDKVKSQFEGDFTLNYHLAPPLISKKNDKGQLIKQKFGPAMLTGFKLLAKMKGLRGTALDIFGKTQERKMERALIGQYKTSIEEVLKSMNADNMSVAIDIARIPEMIKGFGHVKERNVQAAQAKWTTLMEQLQSTGDVRKTGSY
jgi:indolepyruvate ferredoxin oxidoreductase